MIFLLEPLLLVGDEELIELLPLELQLVLGILLDALLIRVVLQNLSRKLNKKSNEKRACLAVTGTAYLHQSSKKI
jgi:hypothetical protein